MDVGLELRQARERRGLSLQQISNTTKVSLRVLQAIEADDERRLPAPVFTRSFVRSYASEVGLDPDDAMRRYLEQFAPPVVATAEAAPQVDSPATLHEKTTFASADLLRSRYAVPAVFAIVVIAIIALTMRSYMGSRSETSRPAAPEVGAAGVAVAGAPPPAPAGTSGTADVPPATHLQLTIAPTGPCWVQATIGGHPVLRELLKAGDHRSVESPSDVTLRIGDPTTCAFSIDGKPARIAAAGHPVTLRITRENYAQFLAR